MGSGKSGSQLGFGLCFLGSLDPFSPTQMGEGGERGMPAASAPTMHLNNVVKIRVT